MSATTVVHQPWCNDHGDDGDECTHAFRIGNELVADVSEERGGGHVLIAWGPTGQPVTPKEARQVAAALYQAAALVESLTAPVVAVSQAERDTGSGLHCPSWCTQHNPDPTDGSCSHFHEVNQIGGIAARHYRGRPVPRGADDVPQRPQV